MKTITVKLKALNDEEVLLETTAVLDVTTFEVVSVGDEAFTTSPEGEFEEFVFELDEMDYPISVDYADNNDNEFMVTSLPAIDAIEDYISENPEAVQGTEDNFEDLDDEDNY